jgi:hypothetical protein
VLKKSYLYIVIEWGKAPNVFRTKKSLVNFLGKKNSRIVDKWFINNWYIFFESKFIIRVEIPKVKSKIR